VSTTSSDAARSASAQGTALGAAFIDTISVGVGMFPLGAAFGVVVVQAGLDWWWALIFSILVYA
jgi:predicted branched-subunit amino acid permease